MKIIPTILCGGAGSRLWPVSRENHPKPFIRLPDGKSLLQNAYLRAIEQKNVHDVLTVTNRDLYFKIEEEYSELKSININNNFVLEPFGKNTAAAVATSALWVSKEYGSDAIMLVLAADHLIKKSSEFSQAVDRAVILAQQGKIVTFGINPGWPETGYGYIKADGERVISFVEKPNITLAKEYFSSNDHFWNSGIFCFRADTIIQEMEKYCADILEKSRICLKISAEQKNQKNILINLDAEHFSPIREESIDYAVMEKTDCAAVITCDIGWSDIGSWTALGALSPIDVNGNNVKGEVLLHQTKNTTIHSEKRLVATVGIENILIIETPDAVLVASKENAQEVKNIYSELKKSDHSAYKTHTTVNRPWGSYTVLEEGPNFKIKRIEVKPQGSLSLQYHAHRSEHWVVISGCATILNNETEKLLYANESTFIPAGNKHRLTNNTNEPVIIIEVQTGDYLGEDDIVRINDIYGRN